MSEINIIAVLSPAPGKASRVKELLIKMCEEVHQKEDFTLRYLMTEQIDGENKDIVMMETYKSANASSQHQKQPHFKELFGTLEKESLLAKAPYIARTANKAGFDLDRKLIGSKI